MSLASQCVCVLQSVLSLQNPLATGSYDRRELVGGGHSGGEGDGEGLGKGGEGSTGLQLLDVVAQLGCCLAGEKVKEIFEGVGNGSPGLRDCIAAGLARA